MQLLPSRFTLTISTTNSTTTSRTITSSFSTTTAVRKAWIAGTTTPDDNWRFRSFETLF
uniref:Uncharacterized protein n=1 Tax=Plectus sambesii TaxID=2011161 RepID=A0A914VPE8_9BILA